MSWLKVALAGLVVLLLSFLFLLVVALVSTWFAYRSIAMGDETMAKRNLRLAIPLVAGFTRLTAQQSETLNCWQTGVEALALIPQFQETLRSVGDSYSSSGKVELGSIELAVRDASTHAEKIRNCIQKVPLLRLVIATEPRDVLVQKIYRLQTALDAILPLFSENQTWVVLFQNTTELRPTGGFTGSYALVEARDGKLQTLTVEDIYDADGQVVRFRDAPPGVAEYTSGKNGLRLPDANWWPDFPTSAQTQLDFLADAGKKNLKGLAAVNLTLLQQILQITGPLALPDYQTSLTPENAPLVLRSHAENFFPGSKEKKQLLSYALQQLQYRLTTLNSNQKSEVLASLLRAVATKEIQLFSTDPQQQATFEQLGIAATLNPSKNPILALVEANVGINKSNQYVTRSLAVQQNGLRLTAVLHLKNTADLLAPDLPASQSGYVNFQRVVTSPGLNITSIKTDTDAQPKVIRHNWSTIAGTMFAEQGLLLSILPGQTQTVTIQLERTDPTQPFTLWHQSGTGEIPLTLIDENGQARTSIFDRDLLVTQ